MHSAQIESLLEHASYAETDADPQTAKQLRAVASLLSLHDRRRISLDKLVDLRTFVESWLEDDDLILHSEMRPVGRSETVIIELNPQTGRPI